MTRITRASAAQTRRSISSAAAKRDKKYKVEYKLVTAQKKILNIVNQPPPPGYKFVAAGSEEFTNFCKEQCRKAGRNVYVSTENRKRNDRAVNDPNRIGFYIGRDGLFFPSSIVKKACDWFNLVIDTDGRPIKPNDHLSRSLRKYSKKEEKAQINAAVRELFPKIPEKAAREIMKHAFQQGKKRVGNASQLSLAGRVQLAVTAHIRHRYTNYDSLLKSGVAWHDARAMIQPACIDKLKEWQGEDGQTEFEETFQEWIDLCDDDDDNEESDVDSPDSSDESRRNSSHGMDAIHEISAEDETGIFHDRSPSLEIVRDMRPVMYRERTPVFQSVERIPPGQSPQYHPSHGSPKFIPQSRLHPTSHSRLQSSYSLQTLPGPTIVQSAPGPSTVILRRSEHDRPHYRPGYPRLIPKDYELETIDLTSSPKAPRTQRRPEYAAPHYTQAHLSHHTAMDKPNPSAPVYVQPLRGGDASQSSPRMQRSVPPASNVPRVDKLYITDERYIAPHSHVANSGRPVVHDAHGVGYGYELPSERDRYVRQGQAPVTHHAHQSAPHPEVPRSGWVFFNRHPGNGELVR